jgi:hypothetical protein
MWASSVLVLVAACLCLLISLRFRMKHVIKAKVVGMRPNLKTHGAATTYRTDIDKSDSLSLNVKVKAYK